MGLVNLETQFVSVERVAQYTRLDRDAIATDCQQQVPVPVPWPDRGELQIDSLDLRCVGLVRSLLSSVFQIWVSPSSSAAQLFFEGNAPHPPPMCHRMHHLMRHLTLQPMSAVQVPAGAKVAVCGRTGCGKSSLFSAICGLYPASSGRIAIDGIDIKSLPLRTLRRGLRVISQDALLLPGTLRANVKGFDDSAADGHSAEADDNAVWAALHSAGIGRAVEALPNELDTLVETGGANFSVGERQLLTLARALVPRDGHPPRLMLCDEVAQAAALCSYYSSSMLFSLCQQAGL